MGYLANKRHKARESAFLRMFFILSGVVTLLAFGSTCVSFFFNECRWQLYLLLAAVFLYCLLRRFFICAFLAFILGTVNYFTVSSVVGVWGASSTDKGAIRLLLGSHTEDFTVVLRTIEDGDFQIVVLNHPNFNGDDIKDELSEKYSFLHPAEGFENGFMLVSLPVEVSGRVNLGKEIWADFVKVLIDGRQQTFISVDFSGLKRQKAPQALDNLSSFIRRQDNPVIVFGNFNDVAWSKNMSRFIAQNGLQTKNALMDNIRNLILPPKYYIFGYELGDVSGRLILPRLNSFSLFTRF